MSTSEDLKQVNRLSRDLTKAEQRAIARLNRRLSTNYNRLEKRLLRRYDQLRKNDTLLPNQRTAVLLDEVKDLLDPTRGWSANDFSGVLQKADQEGRKLAEKLLGGKVESRKSRVRANFFGGNLRKTTALLRESKANQTSDFRPSTFDFLVGDSDRRLHKWGNKYTDEVRGIVDLANQKGWGSGRVRSALLERLGVAQFRSETIVRTGTTSAVNNALVSSYQTANIRYVQWISQLLDTTCPYCASRHMKVYRLKEVAGSIPAHANCVCIFLAVVDLDKVDKLFAATERKRVLKELEAAGGVPRDDAAPFESAAPKAVYTPDADNIKLRELRRIAKEEGLSKEELREFGDLRRKRTYLSALGVTG